MLEFLNISEKHLNMIAALVHKQAFGEKIRIPNELKQYINSAAKYVWNGYNATYTGPHSSLNQIFETNSKITADLDQFFKVLTKVPTEHGFILYNQEFQNVYFLDYNEFDKSKVRTFLSPRFTWVNNAFCLLFKSEAKYDKTGEIFNGMVSLSLRVSDGARYWLGNISTDFIHVSNFHSGCPKCRIRQMIETVIFENNSSSSDHKSICQNFLSFHHTQGCKIQEMHQYPLFMIHEPRRTKHYHPFAIIRFSFDMQSWHVTRCDVYSWLAMVEMTTSVLGLFLGFSLFQILSICLVVLGKWWKFFAEVMLRVALFLLLALGAVCLFVHDFNDLFEDRFVHKISLGSELPMPTFKVSVRYGLNFSKIRDLNISVGLLKYLHVASGSNLMLFNQAYLYTERAQFPNPFNTDNLLLGKQDYLQQIDKQSCEGSLSHLHHEYEILATKMGYDHQTPAYKLFEHLYIDKCRYILYCEFNGRELRNCCNEFKYSFHVTRTPMPFLVLKKFQQKFLKSKQS